MADPIASQITVTLEFAENAPVTVSASTGNRVKGVAPAGLLEFLAALAPSAPDMSRRIADACERAGVHVPPTAEERLDANRVARRALSARLRREADVGLDVLTNAEWGQLDTLLAGLLRAKD